MAAAGLGLAICLPVTSFLAFAVPAAASGTGPVLVSVGAGGALPDSVSFHSRATPDGRYAVFVSYADNLVPGYSAPGGQTTDIYVRDLTGGTTTLASVSDDGVPADQC